MTGETLSQVYDALYKIMGSDLLEWIRKERPSGEQMRDKLLELKTQAGQRGKVPGRDVIWNTGALGPLWAKLIGRAFA